MSGENEEVAFAIKKVQSRHHRGLDTHLQLLGVSLVQWNALREIDRNPGVSAHALPELTFNSDQSFGALASRLVRLGFVVRASGEGRALVHTLTVQGKEVLRKGQRIHHAFLEASFKPLRIEERALLLDLLNRLLQANDGE